MTDPETITVITTFLGWATLGHFILLALIAIVLIGFRGWIVGVHQRMFALDEAALNQQYFQYLAVYKILVIVFFLVPYLVLRVVM
jgi:hypothetical protein